MKLIATRLEPHIELAARILERRKAAFIFAELFRHRGLCAPVSRDTAIGATHEQDRQSECDENE